MNECGKCSKCSKEQWDCVCYHMKDLLGQTIELIEAEVGSDRVKIVTQEGATYLMFHDQDCCEDIEVNEIIGDLEDLIGSPLVMAEESSNNDDPKPSEYSYSWTWTFYRFATAKGTVVLRWLGESNGYYGESVEIHRVS